MDVIYIENQLQERLAYWQKQLRLEDWEIEVNIRRGRDMLEGCSASVNWELGKKMASISILDQIDYPPDAMGDRDMENDLVHELLHLHFAPISEHFGETNKSFYYMFEEQAINCLADSLVRIERKGQDDGNDL